MKKDYFRKLIKIFFQIKKKIILGILIAAIIIGGAVFILLKEASKYSLEGLEKAVFYYKGINGDSRLYYAAPNQEPVYLLTLPSEEIDVNRYKVPKHSYISHNGKVLIYFERIKTIPVGEVKEGWMAYRVVYKPKYINLEKGDIFEIKQEIDAGGIVFSPDDKKIAWVKRVNEATVEELEAANKEREIWISDINGDNPKFLTAVNEKVVLLQTWADDYLYFWGIQSPGEYSLGRINIKNGQVERFQPRYCLEKLTNCQNFKIDPRGKYFIYEADIVQEDKEGVDLFVESFDKEESWQIVVNNYISDRLWFPLDKTIIYTEQVARKGSDIEEKIHLVKLETKEDKEIYSGSYLSQITPDKTGQYLYFIEKETDQKFNLTKINIQTGQKEILASGRYDQLKIISSW